MKSITRIFVSSIFVLLLLTQNSFAIGIGGFVDVSSGSGSSKWDNGGNSWNMDTSAFAFGFVLDTAPTDEKVFNYRLNIGYAEQDMKDENNIKLKSKGAFVENIFGFALVRNSDTMAWLEKAQQQ